MSPASPEMKDYKSTLTKCNAKSLKYDLCINVWVIPQVSQWLAEKAINKKKKMCMGRAVLLVKEYLVFG